MGSQFGEDGLMAALSREWSLGGVPESRMHIQSMLKGTGTPTPEPEDAKEWLFLEACVFLELGRELDQRELELMQNLQSVNVLESKLLESLGADEEDETELQRALETTNPPLSPDWGHFSYLLKLRMGFWFRLFSQLVFQTKHVVLTALSRDVVDEVLDPFQTERERHGEAWDRNERVLLRLPRVDLLDEAGFKDVFVAMLGSQERVHLMERLEDFLGNPSDAGMEEALSEAAESYQGVLGELVARQGVDPSSGDGYRLVLTRPSDLRLRDVWRRFDREGYRELAREDWGDYPAVFIHLEH